MAACIEDPVVIKQVLDHLRQKVETSKSGVLPASRCRRLSCTTGCLTDEPKSQRYQSKCCAHATAAEICRAG